jgi:hypothetical protein
MTTFTVFDLSDIATEAQHSFQQQFSHIDPVIGINRGMRERGFAADLLTIDCIKSKKRITFLLNDSEPNIVSYQLGFTDVDPSQHFETITLEKLNGDSITALMVKHFSNSQ